MASALPADMIILKNGQRIENVHIGPDPGPTAVRIEYPDGRVVIIEREVVRNIIKSQEGDLLSGIWQGKYVCRQGRTSLDLVIFRNGPDEIGAVFNFYPDPENPAVPSGSFRMKGNFDNLSHRLTLKGVEWIKRPSMFYMADLDGSVTADFARFSGQIVGYNCSTFTLFRVKDL